MKPISGKRAGLIILAGLLLSSLFIPVAIAKHIDGEVQTLLGTGDDYDGRLEISEGDARLKAIHSLESSGSRKAVQALLKFLTTADASTKHKKAALMALGHIGTSDAVKAVASFEQWAEARRKTEPELRLAKQDYGLIHFSPFTIQIIAQCVNGKGQAWALVSWSRFAPCELWLAPVKDGQATARPILLDLPSEVKPGTFGDMLRNKRIELRPGEAPDSFVLVLGDLSVPFLLADIAKDSDGDGLSDLRERHMATNPDSPDTDKDGVSDAEDPAPQFPRNATPDDAAQIRQAVFTLCFATTNARNTLWITPKTGEANQEYYGYLGTLLAPIQRMHVTLDVRWIKGDMAIVELSDYEGPLAASSNEITVRKLHGKWVGTDLHMQWIS